MNSSSSSSGNISINNVTFINNETSDQINHYIDDICSDPNFLCNNKKLCGTSTSIYTSVDNVEQICTDMEKSKICEDDIKECVVTTDNEFGDSKQTITTSFVNIIVPIKGAFDDSGNQKFIRLPALSSSKNPNSEDICNICMCMNRFSTAPGSGGVINESSYTAPGQNICIYPDFIEHYYYPLSIENITTKLKDTPPIKVGKYTVLNSNIIYAHSEEQLLVPNLYDLLIKNGITHQITVSFITNVLYKNKADKAKELQLYIKSKNQKQTKLINKGLFYQNITFFYILFSIFVLLLLINLI
uniref:Uncharacterized protein n=1 Tax=viral metagenome TaxID=1070528 RepID=A0A6C0B136_9ZZZZ